MYRELVRKLRLVAPSFEVRVLVGVVLIIVMIFHYKVQGYLAEQERIRKDLGWPESIDLSPYFIAFFIVLICVCYAYYRSTRFNPLFDMQYQQWLAGVPWDPSKPLPLGPMMLSWEDLVILSPMLVFSVYYLGLPGLEVILFSILGVYLFVMTLVLFIGKGQNPIKLLMLFSIPFYLPAGIFHQFWIMKLLSLAHYILIWFAMRQAIRTIPEIQSLRLAATKESLIESAKRCVQWPFNHLGPDDGKSDVTLSTPKVIVLYTALCWWLIVVLTIPFPNDAGTDHSFSSWILRGVGLFTCVARIILCYGAYRAPINPIVRIKTGKWIIPRYDYALIAPFICAAIVLVGPWALNSEFATPYAINPNDNLLDRVGHLFRYDVMVNMILLFASLLIVTFGRPSIVEWKLVGLHRYAPMQNEANRDRRSGSAFNQDISIDLTKFSLSVKPKE